MVNSILISIIKTIKKTFRCKGRSSRKEFCIYSLFVWFYGLLVIKLDLKYGHEGIVLLLGLILFFIYIPFFSLIVRRFHDVNSSGWYQLVFFIPFGLILFFALFFYKGTPTANRYGETPSD